MSCPCGGSGAGLRDARAGLSLPAPRKGVGPDSVPLSAADGLWDFGQDAEGGCLLQLAFFFKNFFPPLSWWLLFEGSPRWFPLTHLSAFESRAFHRSGCECGSAGAAGGTEQGLGMLEGRRSGAASLCPGKVPGKLKGSTFALSFASKSGLEPGISVLQEPCGASAGGTLPRLPGLGSRIRANPVLRQKVMGGKEAIIKQTPQCSPTTHGFDTINRREGTKIAPRVAVWTQRGSGTVSGLGGCSPNPPRSPGVTGKLTSCSAAAVRQYPGAEMMSGLQGRHLSPCKTCCTPHPCRGLALSLCANPVPSP